jgi:hypothetical protein
MAGTGAFDKDFGYLMPFLDRLEAHAAGLPEGAAREELRQLVAEAKAHWPRIRELVSGAPGQGTGGVGKGRVAPLPALTPLTPGMQGVRKGAPLAARSSSDDVNRVSPQSVGLTVGSLKRQPT